MTSVDCFGGIFDSQLSISVGVHGGRSRYRDIEEQQQTVRHLLL